MRICHVAAHGATWRAHHASVVRQIITGTLDAPRAPLPLFRLPASMVDDPSNPLKLFLGGLAYETTEDSIRQYFEKFGPVGDTQVVRDRNTGQSRGFGFVTFVDVEVSRAAQASDHMIDGAPLPSPPPIARTPTSPLALHRGH